eukprot:Lithocolla_globosa_v1_NODE_136_length_5835_cov_11.826644.p4 type:complete len:162 gc:universal NODE_136_length_5835_cov_11.826644:3180-3665(+)
MMRSIDRKSARHETLACMKESSEYFRARHDFVLMRTGSVRALRKSPDSNSPWADPLTIRRSRLSTPSMITIRILPHRKAMISRISQMEARRAMYRDTIRLCFIVSKALERSSGSTRAELGGVVSNVRPMKSCEWTSASVTKRPVSYANWSGSLSLERAFAR